MTTLQSTLDRLTTLARETGAEFQGTIQLEESGATLVIHWCGIGEDILPREANLYFGTDIQANPDVFLFGFIIDPLLYCWAVDEGVDELGCTNHATRMIEEIDEVVNYLQGHPYAFYRPKEKKNQRRGLDKG